MSLFLSVLFSGLCFLCCWLPAERGRRGVEIPHEKLCKCLWHLKHEQRQEVPEVSQERYSHEFPTQFGTVKKLDSLLTNIWFLKATKPLYLLRFAHDYVLQNIKTMFQSNWTACVKSTPDWKEHWLSIGFNLHLIPWVQLPSNQLSAGESFQEQGDSAANSGKQTSPRTQPSFMRPFY